MFHCGQALWRATGGAGLLPAARCLSHAWRGEAVAVVAADDGLGGLGVVGEGEFGLVPEEFLTGEAGGLDGEQHGFGDAHGVLEGGCAVRSSCRGRCPPTRANG